MEKTFNLASLVILMIEDLTERLEDLSGTDYEVVSESLKLVEKIQSLGSNVTEIEKLLNSELKIAEENLNAVSLAKAEISAYFKGVLQLYLL
jgi:predicted  nucleic acid-binding Zn-ribbon protein